MASKIFDLTVYDVARWIKGRFMDRQEESAYEQAPETGKEAAAVVDPYYMRGQGLEIPHGTYQIKGLEIVERMMKDEMFGTGVELKKAVALSSGYDIEPGIADDKKSEEIAECIKASYEGIESGIVDEMADQLSAVEYGYSAANIVYQVIEAGDFKGKIGLQALKTKDPCLYRFDVDEFMNIKENGLLFTNPRGFVDAQPKDAFAIYTYRKRFNNPYGYGDAIRAYDRWNSKYWAVKFWDIYLERTGTGTVIFKYDRKNKPPKDEFTAVQSFINEKQVRSGLMVSKDWDHDMHESPGTGGRSFETAVNHRNIAIARSLFLPDQIGFSDSSTVGSMAKAKVHLDVFMMPILRLHRDLERVHNQQVIKRLVDYNYGPQGKYPKLKFNPISDDQKIWWLTNVFTGIEKGALTPDLEIENAIRRHLELVEKEKEEEKKAGGSPPMPRELEEPAVEIDITKLQRPEEKTRKLRSQTKYERKVDIDGIAMFMDETQQGFVETWASYMKENKQAMMDFVKRTNAVVLKDRNAIGGLKMKRNADQTKSFQRFNMASTYYGSLEGQREIERAKKNEYTFAAYQSLNPQEMPLTEIEAYFQELGLVTTPAIREAARAAKDRAFWITGVENEKVLAQAKIILYNGIDRGDQIWAMQELEKLFQGYLLTGQITDKALGEAYRIETIARNNFVRSINQGRKAYMESKEVQDYVVAYQWSSILDSNTTDYCREMDGRVLSKTELNSIGWPPAHHNCRSFVVPVVEGEEYELAGVPKNVERGSGFRFHEHGELLKAVS